MDRPLALASLTIGWMALLLAAAPLQGGKDGAKPAAKDDPALTELDRKVMLELTGSRETPRATFHFVPPGSPGAIDAKALDEDVAADVAALAGLEKTLQMTYRGRVHFFLYRDVEEMKRLTGAGGGTAAFSTGTVSIHQPHEFRGVHELVHIFALQFEREADTSGPDLFTTEGLATYLAESDEGVAIHSWAAAYAKGNVLPASIVAIRATFPEGCAAGVHPYHVAGSYCGFLVDRFGIAKVKRWYADSTEAHRYFGASQAKLEREWREFLAKRPLSAADQSHVFKKLGLEGEPIPAAWAGAKGSPLFDGKSLSGLVAQDPARWSVKDGRLVGTNDGPWTAIETAKRSPATVGVRAKLRLASGNAVKLTVGGKEAILATWSSYATAGAGFAGNERVKITPGKWVEFVVVNDAGRARVWLDGVSLFDNPGIWSDATESPLTLAVERGTVEVQEWVVFD